MHIIFMVGINKFYSLANRRCFACDANLKDNASVGFEHSGEIKFFCKAVECQRKAARLFRGEVSYLIPTKKEKKLATVSTIK